jgi:hypothetical protein
MAELFWRMRAAYGTFVTASPDKRWNVDYAITLRQPQILRLTSSLLFHAARGTLFPLFFYSSIIPLWRKRDKDSLDSRWSRFFPRELVSTEWRSGSRDWSLMDSTEAISFIIGCPVACWTTHDKKRTAFSSLLSVPLERPVFVSLSFTIYRSRKWFFCFILLFVLHHIYLPVSFPNLKMLKFLSRIFWQTFHLYFIMFFCILKYNVIVIRICIL